MIHSIKIQYFSWMFFLGFLQAQDYNEKNQETTKFLSQNICPVEIQELIKNQKNDFIVHGNDVKEYKNIPYFHKGTSFERIINARRLENVIKKHNLNRIKVAKKWVCADDKGYFVLAEKVTEGKALYPFSEEEIKQLITLTEHTGYRDYARFSKYDTVHNIIRDKDGFLVIIDTENRSFGFVPDKIAAWIIEAILCEERWQPEGFALELSHDFRIFLEKKLHDLLYKKSSEFIPSLPNNMDYDSSGINYELLGLEYNYYLEEQVLLQREEDHKQQVLQFQKEQQAHHEKLEKIRKALLAKIIMMRS